MLLHVTCYTLVLVLHLTLLSVSLQFRFAFSFASNIIASNITIIVHRSSSLFHSPRSNAPSSKAHNLGPGSHTLDAASRPELIASRYLFSASSKLMTFQIALRYYNQAKPNIVSVISCTPDEHEHEHDNVQRRRGGAEAK